MAGTVQNEIVPLKVVVKISFPVYKHQHLTSLFKDCSELSHISNQACCRSLREGNTAALNRQLFKDQVKRRE